MKCVWSVIWTLFFPKSPPPSSHLSTTTHTRAILRYLHTVKQDTNETRSRSFDSRRHSRQQIFSEMPFHKFLIVVVGYYTSREISVHHLGAYRQLPVTQEPRVL